MRKYPAKRWVSGAFKRECDRCGMDFLSINLQKEWNGAWVCESCFDPRHMATMPVKIPNERPFKRF